MRKNKAERIINEIIDEFSEQIRPVFLKIMLEEERSNYIVKHKRKNVKEPNDALIDGYLDAILESGLFRQKADRKFQNFFNSIQVEISKHLRRSAVKSGVLNVMDTISGFTVFSSYVVLYILYAINKDLFPKYVSDFLNWPIVILSIYGLLSFVITPIIKYILEDKNNK